MSLKWTDSLDIAIDLSEKYPDTDPKYIRFTDLHKWIIELENFDEAKKTAIVFSLIMSMRQYTEIEFPDDILEWNPYEDGTLTLPKGVKFNK